MMFWIFWVSGIELFPNPYVGWFIFGCISGGTSYAIDSAFSDLGINVNHSKKDLE